MKKVCVSSAATEIIRGSGLSKPAPFYLIIEDSVLCSRLNLNELAGGGSELFWSTGVLIFQTSDCRVQI